MAELFLITISRRNLPSTWCSDSVVATDHSGDDHWQWSLLLCLNFILFR